MSRHRPLRKLHMPFPMFYLEFTEPILFGTAEPGKRDFLRALLISSSDYYGIKGTIRLQSQEDDTKMEDVSIPLCQATAFLTSTGERGEPEFIDRSWKFSLEHGIAFTTVNSAIAGGSEIPSDWPMEAYVPCTLPIAHAPDRIVGWYENTVTDYTTLITWILTYLMAKSIVVVQEPESRQVRRARERQNLPAMWHVVKLDPKFYTARKPSEEEPQWHHGHQYDVIGHLRFGRHKTKEGFSETIEWVPPHRRGLANDLYIPKTYKVDRGKVVSQRMKEYFRPD